MCQQTGNKEEIRGGGGEKLKYEEKGIVNRVCGHRQALEGKGEG